jgi:octaprenyl-diphosphate synthase
MITADELNLVEGALLKAIRSDVDLLLAASEYIIRSGGKRLRPQVVLLSCKAVGGQDTMQAIPLAAAVELLHTASLIHDDINDRSELRRGHATVNARWGNSLALLIGDFIFVRLLNLIADLDPQVIQIMSRCCTAIVEGETLQMMHLGDLGTTEETYLRIVALKTALLFSACSELGAIVAGANKDQIAALKTYGFNLGVAFQIRDDTLDLVGKVDELGKPIARDLEQGKMSLATIYALKRSETAREVLIGRDSAQALALLQETGALYDAKARAAEYAARATEALAILSDSGAKAQLQSLAEFAIIRDQ